MKLARRPGRSTACRHRHTIGLDLGATAVRVAVMSPSTDGPPVVADQLGGLALRPGIVVDGVVQDPPALTAALKELWRTHDIGCRHVVLGMASPQVQVREMQVPDLDTHQRAQSLPFQARDIVAMPLDQVVLDFAELGEPDPETHLVNGLLVASPREPLTTAVAAVEAAGLTVVRVDLASFAVLRAVARTGLRSEAVIDIGAHLTTVAIHHDGVPGLVRTLTRGGDDITRRLAQRLAISEEQAEQLKCDEGLEGTGEAATALRSLVTPLLTDIRTSINYFRSSHAGALIEHVTLTGRGALLRGLAQAVSAQLGSPTEVAAPGALHDGGLLSETADPALISSLSIGLAIGAAA